MHGWNLINVYNNIFIYLCKGGFMYIYVCIGVGMCILACVCVRECTRMCQYARECVKCIFIFICMFGYVLQRFGLARTI